MTIHTVNRKGYLVPHPAGGFPDRGCYVYQTNAVKFSIEGVADCRCSGLVSGFVGQSYLRF
jgi:hypothetical protein